MSTASNHPFISSEEIRNTFLDFFKNKQHQIVASSSLVPGEDFKRR
jgi:alanyl-tRNA synthetase